MSDQTDHAVQALIKTEKAWVQAHRDLDIKRLNDIMADDYTVIWSDGTVVGKDADLATYQVKDRWWEIAESDDYYIRIYGDVGILIGRWHGKGSNGGESFDYTARFTAIYIKKGGRWQMVHSQSTPIKDI